METAEDRAILFPGALRCLPAPASERRFGKVGPWRVGEQQVLESRPIQALGFLGQASSVGLAIEDARLRAEDLFFLPACKQLLSVVKERCGKAVFHQERANVLFEGNASSSSVLGQLDFQLVGKLQGQGHSDLSSLCTTVAKSREILTAASL